MDRRIDAIGAFGFAMLGGLFITLSWVAPPREVQHDALGPYLAPAVLASLMVVLGCLQGWRSIRLMRMSGRFGPHEGRADEPDYPVSRARGLAFIAAVLLYPLLLSYIGYLIVTPALVIAGLWSLNYRQIGRLVVAAATFTGAVYFVFESLLSVPLPQGLLAFGT